MGPREWLILVLGIVVGVGLWMFAKGHINLTMDRSTPDSSSDGAPGAATSQRAPRAKPAGPVPSDKYLPVWVILSMALAVGGLAWQINSIVTEVCGHPGRCQTVQAETDAKAKLELAKSKVDAEAAKAGDAKAPPTASAPEDLKPK